MNPEPEPAMSQDRPKDRGAAARGSNVVKTLAAVVSMTLGALIVLLCLLGAAATVVSTLRYGWPSHNPRADRVFPFLAAATLSGVLVFLSGVCWLRSRGAAALLDAAGVLVFAAAVWVIDH